MRARTRSAAASLLAALLATPSAHELDRVGLANLRRLALLLTACLAWSFAIAPVALAATPQAQGPRPAPVRPFTTAQIRQTLNEIERGRRRQEVVRQGMQAALARARASLVDTHYRPDPRVRPLPPHFSLLDVNGRLRHRADPFQAGQWKRELKTTHPAPERAAALHVWLGEWELAANEQPAQARWHFAQAQRLLPRTDGLHGLAAYDNAIALFYAGAYADATEAFHRLLLPATALPGYRRPTCALWWRHAAACDGYHQDHAKMGIPEPPALDPLCGAAALAASLRALRLPCDRKTVLASCRVTGLGSNLADLLAAGPGLGVRVRSLTATDQGLMALPKPLVAYVEHDHFISVVRADKRGVAYLCSDCGPWPGGEVDLTWRQWHALSPGVYAAVTRPGSHWDLALASLAGVQTASLPGAGRRLEPGKRLASLVPALPALRGVSLRQMPGTYTACGGKWVALIEACEVGAPKLTGPATPANPKGPTTWQPLMAYGPSAGDPVNLSTGVEEYAPPPDLTVYNPVGPSVSWGRVYDSLDVNNERVNSYQTEMLGSGWSSTYDCGVTGDGGVSFPNGSEIHFTNPSQTPTVGHPVQCQVQPGSPLLVELDLHPPDPNYNNQTYEYYTITFPDRTRWVTDAYYGDYYTPIVQMIDRNGNAIYLHRDGGPQLSSITNSAGTALLTFTYDDNSDNFNLVCVSDCYGRSVYYTLADYSNYSELSCELTGVSQVVPTGTANAVSQYPRYAYGYQEINNPEAAPDAFLNTITVPSPAGTGTSTATISYNSSYESVSGLTDGNGSAATIHYQGETSTRVTVSGASSYTYTVGYDGNMSQTSQTDGAGHAVSTVNGFDPNDPYRPTSVTDGNGNTTNYTWDTYGNLLTETPPSSGQRTPAGTTNTYSYVNFALGELVGTRTGAKTPTSYAYYEPSGLVQTVTGPQPGTTGAAAIVLSASAYDGLGNVTSVKRPGPNSTPATTTASPGFGSYATTTMGYTTDGGYSQADAIGQPLTVTDPLGHVTHLRYDTRGNATATIDAVGYETDTTYNIDDRSLSTVYPATGQSGSGRGSTLSSYLYNGPGPGQQYGPLVSVKTFDEGNTAGAFRTVSYSYGPEGETLGVSGSTEPVTYQYDSLYRLTGLTDGGGHTTHYFYNAQGYLYQTAYPGAGSPSAPLAPGSFDTVTYTSYDLDGDMTGRVDGNGTTTTYAYQDPESRLTNVHYAPGSGVASLADTTYSYDAYGRRQTMADGTGQQSYAYGDDDRLTADTTTYAGLPARTISYAFDPDGSRASMSTPAGGFSYGYDSAGRTTALTNPAGQSFSWAYYANDWTQSQSLPGGVTTTDTYNARGQVTDRLTARSGSGLTEFGSVRYDGAGDRTAVSCAVPSTPYSGSTAYAYDGKSQLTGESSSRNGGYAYTHAYDGAENPTTFRNNTVGAASADNQLPGISYDGDGAPTTCKGTSVTYDPEGRAVNFYGLVASAYTGDGLRGVKYAGGYTYFLYDGDAPVCELNSSGAVTAVNTFGPAGLLARGFGTNGVTGTFLYTWDLSGNLARRLDASGNVLASAQFDGFGAATSTDNSPDPFSGFGGQWGGYTDAAQAGQTGLTLFTHRFYDPATGRFLTRDPLGYTGGINLYGYTQNDPVNDEDPTGYINQREQNRLRKLAERCGFSCRDGSNGHIICVKGGVTVAIPGVHSADKDVMAARQAERVILANCGNPQPEPVPVPVIIPAPLPNPGAAAAGTTTGICILIIIKIITGPLPIP